MTFNSIPFRVVNETHTEAINHTIYDMECKAFERLFKDRYTEIYIHHRFATGKIKPSMIRNPIPANLDLDANGGNGLMPLVFNRTETNQQYLNLTFSAKLDALNILKNVVYNRPETMET